MTMNAITISVPTPLKNFIDRQVAVGGFDSPENYLLTLLEELHQDQDQDPAEMKEFLRKSREDIDAGQTRPMLQAIESLGKST
jgi:Arc/MetJ-type ribon-helix-helix transcriptional regulator